MELGINKINHLKNSWSIPEENEEFNIYNKLENIENGNRC